MIDIHTLQSTIEILSALDLTDLERDLIDHYLNGLPSTAISIKHGLTRYQLKCANAALFEKCRQHLWSRNLFSVGDIDIPEPNRTLEGKLSHQKTMERKVANKLSHRKMRAKQPRKGTLTKKMLRGLEVAVEMAEPLNVSKLAQDIGVSRQTLTAWLAPTHRFRQVLEGKKNGGV